MRYLPGITDDNILTDRLHGCMCMRDCPTGAITIKNLGIKENKEMHAYLKKLLQRISQYTK